MSIAIPGQRAAVLSGIASPRGVPGLLLWLDATAVPPVADGTAVATWSDKSNRGNDATQATGTKQPLYKVGVQNGLPGLLFDGTDDSLACNGPAPFFTGEDKPGTIIVVIKEVSVAATHAFVCFASTVSGSPIYALRQSGNNLNFIKRDDALTLKQTSGGTIGTTATRILSLVCTGQIASQWLDGVAGAGAQNIDVDIGTAAIISGRIGARDNAGIQVDPVNGYIFEVLVWPRALTIAERRAMERYLGNKWGVVVV